MTLPSAPLVDVRHKLPPLKALTALRFLAAMYVVVYHMDFQKKASVPLVLRNFLSSGYTGVTLFFVLSGFILAYNYPRVTDRRDFWIARFARVYPAYFLTCCYSLLRPAEWHMEHFVASTAMAFALVQTWWPPFSGALNQYGWTLSVEAFFYLAFPFLLPLMQRMPKRVFYAIQVVYLVVLCLPIVFFAQHKDAITSEMIGILEGRIPVMRLNTFFVGMYVALGWLKTLRDRGESKTLSSGPASSGLARHWQLIVGTVGSLILLSASVPGQAMPLRTGLLTYSYALIIRGLAEVEWPILTNHWAQVGGEISYGIYILQFPVIFSFYSVLWHFRPGSSPSPLLYTVTLILVAYASFRWYETPARLWIRRTLTHRPVATRPV